MTCPQCQQDNPADARFCNGCGSRLLVACPSCEQPNPPASRFCNGCGQKLADAGAPAPAPRFTDPYEAGRQLADLIPGAQFYTFKGRGHALYATATAEFVQVPRDLLGGGRPGEVLSR